MAGRIDEYHGMTVYTHYPETTMWIPVDKLMEFVKPVLNTWKGLTVRQKDANGTCNLRFLDTSDSEQVSRRYSYDHTIGTMSVTPVPHCCGLCLGSGFNSIPLDIKCLDPMFEWFEYISWYEMERAQVTYVSTDHQNEINEVLRARGYEQVYEFTNANTGNSIYNWFKDVEGDPIDYDDDYDEDDYYDE